jgi:hypothetical protein
LEFNHPNAPPTVVEPPNDVFDFPSASEHASELQFLFNFGTTLSADEQQLAAERKTYWWELREHREPEPAATHLLLVAIQLHRSCPRPCARAEGSDPFH